jgi:hypothetical protein
MPGGRADVIWRGVLIVGAMLAAVAAAPAETPQQRQACMDDAFQFCSDAIPDRERVFACLVEKRSLISPLCREGMAAFLPPERAPAVQPVSRVRPKARGDTKRKGDRETKGDLKSKRKTEVKAETKTKSSTRKTGAPLSLSPNAR